MVVSFVLLLSLMRSPFATDLARLYVHYTHSHAIEYIMKHGNLVDFTMESMENWNKTDMGTHSLNNNDNNRFTRILYGDLRVYCCGHEVPIAPPPLLCPSSPVLL